VARLTYLTVVGAIACGLAGVVHAADLPEPAAFDSEAEVVELGTGWYLRGDVGYIDYATPRDVAFGIPGTLPLDGERLDKTFSLGGGIGYQFTSWVRTDVTVDHRFGAEFSGTRPVPTYAIGYERDQADLESTTYLFNAYFDLGYWAGVTPYVGAGIGLASNRFTNIRRDAYVLGLPAGGTVLWPHTTHNLAWALMAGVVVDVGAGFKIDLGYRYADLGDVRTRIDGPGNGITVDELKAHEVRVGARYVID
jgi:opacity protein-like surface antigen